MADKFKQQLERRQSAQGRALLELFAWRERDEEVEVLSEAAARVLTRLTSLWEQLNTQYKEYTSNANHRQTHADTYQISDRQALQDWNDAHLWFGYESKGFKQGQRALIRERLNKAHFIAEQSMKVKDMVAASKALIELDRLNEIEEENNVDKVRSRAIFAGFNSKESAFLAKTIEDWDILDVDEILRKIEKEKGLLIEDIEFEDIEYNEKAIEEESEVEGEAWV
jgi:hypothetical protein